MKIMKFDRHKVEPVTLSKYSAEYEQMWNSMVEFLKYQGRGMKIDRVYSIRVAKSMIFFNILRAIAPWETSSWAIVYFALSLRLFPLVYILCKLKSSIHTDIDCQTSARWEWKNDQDVPSRLQHWENCLHFMYAPRCVSFFYTPNCINEPQKHLK